VRACVWESTSKNGSVQRACVCVCVCVCMWRRCSPSGEFVSEVVELEALPVIAGRTPACLHGVEALVGVADPRDVLVGLLPACA
jgi:hypothetical protein